MHVWLLAILLAAVAAPWVYRIAGTWSGWIMAIVPASVFTLLLYQASRVVDGQFLSTSWEWITLLEPGFPTPSGLYEWMLVSVNRFARWQTSVLQNGYSSSYLLTMVATTVASVWLSLHTESLSRILDFEWDVREVGSWPAPFGITLVADLLSSIMVMLASVMGLAVSVFYIIHHIVVKTNLFLIGGIIEQRIGSGRGFRRHPR